MKTLLSLIAVTLTFATIGHATQDGNIATNHAECLSKADVAWYTNRSKSGIARTCTNEILKHNLSKALQR